MRVLVVVDMQNDFIHGSLGSDRARNIIPRIVDIIASYDGKIMLTRDSHGADYLSTQEGARLPIPHCIEGTSGHDIHADIMAALMARMSSRSVGSAPNSGVARASDSHISECVQDCHGCTVVDKPTFGSLELVTQVKRIIPDIKGNSIELVGLCTDVCVVSNAILLKAAYHNATIAVIADCTSGVTPELHSAALAVMQSCQIDII